MSKRLLLISLVAGALVLGCTEGTAPPSEPPVPDASPHFLQWDRSDGPISFAATGETPDGDLDIVRPPLLVAGDSIGLDTYEVSFWAVRGETRVVTIHYVDATGTVEAPYVRLAVSDPAVRPDGSPIAVGDSVFITVAVDPTDLAIHLAPSGLVFGTATELQMWYGGAVDDLNGDGSVNTTDATIQHTQLGMWWTVDVDAPWAPTIADHDPAAEWFRGWLQHFSGYAISW